MRLRLLLACATLSIGVQHGPASATELPVFTSGSVIVYSDLSACATVSFPAPTTFAGSFSAAGTVAGPGTIVGPVAGAIPVIGVETATWGPRCIPGAYSGAVAGHVTYTFHVSATGGGDYVAVLQCRVFRGSVVCT